MPGTAARTASGGFPFQFGIWSYTGSVRAGPCDSRSDGKTPEPQSGVLDVGRSDDVDSLLLNGEAHASDRVRVDRAAVEVMAFDQEKRAGARAAKRPHLPPEPPRQERAVQVEDALPLDEHAAGHAVVARGERARLDLDAESGQPPRHAARRLVNIDENGQTFPHEVRACPTKRRSCVERLS